MSNTKIDVSEVDALVRIRLFEALTVANIRYKTLVERLHDIVFRYDDEWCIIFLNQAWETILGYASTESINKHFMDFVDPEDKPSMVDYIDANDTTYKELRLSHSDGRAIWFELSIEPDDEGNGGVGLLHNIDHHKNIESALRITRDLAIEAMEEKSNFVANMSHEICTPLNGISGGLQLLQTTDMTEEQREYVEIGLKSSKQLQNIANNILEHSKAEAGQLTLEAHELALASMVENALLIATPAQHNLQVISSISDDIPQIIIGDPTKINHVLLNLLSNAFKFTEEGSITLKIGMDADAHQINIIVKDTGIGIPADRQETIFDSFTQVDASITRKYGGAGLGLAITKRLVKLMGGQIFLASKEGLGSQFTVKIPLAQKASQA